MRCDTFRSYAEPMHVHLVASVACNLTHFNDNVDDALHYGQKLRLVANPMVQGETLDGVGGSRPLYLYSRPVGTTHFAKFSRHQLVAFTDRASYDSVWQVSHMFGCCCPFCMGLKRSFICTASIFTTCTGRLQQVWTGVYSAEISAGGCVSAILEFTQSEALSSTQLHNSMLDSYNTWSTRALRLQRLAEGMLMLCR